MGEFVRGKIFGYAFDSAVFVEGDGGLVDGISHFCPSINELAAFLKEEVRENSTYSGENKDKNTENYVGNFHSHKLQKIC
jgi:hypothetical protein